MEDKGFLRMFTELWFTVFPTGFTLQIFDIMAAVLNYLAKGLGIDIKFLGL